MGKTTAELSDIFIQLERANFPYKVSSVPNSSSGLIFVKVRAESGRIFSKNPGKTNFVILSSFYDIGHVQTGILRFGEQLHNALNVH